MPAESERNGPAELSAAPSSLLAVARRLSAAVSRCPRRLTVWAVLVLLVWITLYGWVSDDAAITARSVDNLLQGHGLRWNTDERVQVFTHPLWALLLVPLMAVGLSWYVALLALGLSSTALCLFGTLRIARSPLAALAGIAALALSRAFVDFSTAGLENPLANVLLVLLVASVPLSAAAPRDVRVVSLVLSLLVLTRHDLVLLGLPVLAVTALSAVRAGVPLGRVLVECFIGQLPFVCWEAFSLLYYGFLLPNTAYAKLNTGLERATSFRLGINYYRAALGRDVWTLLGLLAFAAHALRFRASPLAGAVALGAAVYLAYVLWIGGDFMGGRFFVAPLVCCVAVCISRHVHAVPGSDQRLLAGSLVVGAMCLFRPLEPLIGEHIGGVANERAHNVKNTGVWTLLRRGRIGPDNVWLRRGAEWRREAALLAARGEHLPLVKHGHAVGMLGLASGPDVHIIDHLALTDAFLARLPAAYDPRIMAGHFERMGQWSAPVSVSTHCPLEHEVCRFWRDYTITVASGRCTLQDDSACRYWMALRSVVQGDLFSAERWRNIARFNLGLLDGWLDRARYRDAARAYPAAPP